MTAPVPDDPPPVQVILPTGEVVTAHLYQRRQLEAGWIYQVGLPGYSGREDGVIEEVEYRVWVRAPEHARPVDGVSYDAVPTHKLPASRRILGPRRPSGWVLAKPRPGQSASSVLHAPDCREAPEQAPVLSVEGALQAAQDPRVRVCALCGACYELDPLLHGFEKGMQGW
ncbi:DUF6233 domain-containing protein [Streptomyces sp. NPDC001941]|uniref:DUF6233 domain-containing protein n=1 Tax=Streptomyces sp. NPDC001941 TaxID=3154659 RepID=UPI0033266044